MTVLAWVYVAARVVHTAIHIDVEQSAARAFAFAVGLAILILMWLVIVAPASRRLMPMRLPGQLAAAIEVLADIEARHRPVSEALRDWGLSHRFAGAGDRADDRQSRLRRAPQALIARLADGRRNALASDPRRCDLRMGRGAASTLNAAFAENRHAPPPLPEELIAELGSRDLASAPDHVRADLPEWLAPHFEAAFGADWVEEGAALAGRPPLDLRVNTLKADREKVARQLARLGVAPTPYSPVGLRIPPVEGPRRHPNVQAEEAFQRGRIEVQDEGSQIAALLVGAKPGEQVLDLCAGAGGKTLALAASMENRGQIYAYDCDSNRLAPIFDRLKRAGARNVQVRPPRRSALDGLEGPDGPRAGRRALHGHGRLAAAPGREMAGDAGGARRSASPSRTRCSRRRRPSSSPAACSPMPPARCCRRRTANAIAAFLAGASGISAPIPMRQVWSEALPERRAAGGMRSERRRSSLLRVAPGPMASFWRCSAATVNVRNARRVRLRGRVRRLGPRRSTEDQHGQRRRRNRSSSITGRRRTAGRSPSSSKRPAFPTRSNTSTSARASSSRPTSWPSRRTTACRRSSIPRGRTASRSRFSSPPRSSCISAENSESFYPTDERKRVAVDEWLAWQVANVGPVFGHNNHFATTRRRRCPTPSSASATRRTGSTAC